jgi:putative tryptophan/tyrosine transport system substrate-binding protein
MRRREFIAGLGAAAWPVAARAQQPAMPVIGVLSSSRSSASPSGLMSDFTRAFLNGLSEAGYIEGRNVAIEYRSAEERNDRLPALAADLVRHRVAAIRTLGIPATAAAKAATATIPIVFTGGFDPVAVGFVASLAKPGGNVTGVSLLAPELAGKRLALLKELIPSLIRVAVLWNPDDPTVHLSVEETKAAAARLVLALQILETRDADAIDGAVLAAANERAQALLLMPTPLYDGRAEHIAGLAMGKRLPTLHFSKEAVKLGILMSYGPDLVATIRRQAYFVDRILKGAKPADLPVEQPTRFELTVNLKTARALGLTIPATLLATADEVIE